MATLFFYASFMGFAMDKMFDTINLPKRVERTCRKGHSKEKVGKDMEKERLLNIRKELETIIKERLKDKPSDYNDGIIDGIIIAIRTIDG